MAVTVALPGLADGEVERLEAIVPWRRKGGGDRVWQFPRLAAIGPGPILDAGNCLLEGDGHSLRRAVRHLKPVADFLERDTPMPCMRHLRQFYEILSLRE